MFILKSMTVFLFFDLLMSLDGHPITIPIGNDNVTVDKSNPELINYNWEIFSYCFAAAFFAGCLFSGLFYLIACFLKSNRQGFSKDGKKEEGPIIGFILGATGICHVLRAGKTPSVIHETFLGLDYSNVCIAAICIFGGTFLGLYFAASFAIRVNKFYKNSNNKVKVMMTAFWGASYGQLVGTIMFDAGKNVSGFRQYIALMALGACLVVTVIGCTAIHLVKIHFGPALGREEIHEVWIKGSIMVGGLFYVIVDAARFG